MDAKVFTVLLLYSWMSLLNFLVYIVPLITIVETEIFVIIIGSTCFRRQTLKIERACSAEC